MVKSIVICASFRFYQEVLALQQTLETAGIRCEIPVPNDYLDLQHPWKLKEGIMAEAPEVFMAHWKRMETHQARIIDTDLVYIFAGEQGYVGNGVSSEMGFSYGLNQHEAHEKPRDILSSHTLTDVAMQGFVQEVINPAQLVKRLQ